MLKIKKRLRWSVVALNTWSPAEEMRPRNNYDAREIDMSALVAGQSRMMVTEGEVII